MIKINCYVIDWLFGFSLFVVKKIEAIKLFGMIGTGGTEIIMTRNEK